MSQFINGQTMGCVLLALVALVLSNSPLQPYYETFLNAPSAVHLAGDWLVLSKPTLVWINDLWMAVFFFLVGLEIKRELIEGELASRAQALLPAGAALGGMLVPALNYAAFNTGNPVGLRGLGIPMATDVAFALGILLLLGSRVPASLKIFLTAVAIVDDLGAILVIAFFYTTDLSLTMLLAAGGGVVVLVALNRCRVMAIGPYVKVGLVIWVLVLKSGVHATLAGVITALAVPLSDGRGGSPLKTAEHALHPWVAYAVLPVFAFANAGVFGASWLLIRFGGCVLCGVGFTMTLFIGSLAFEGADPAYATQLKIGVLMGSLTSAAVATLLLVSQGRQA